MHNRQVLLNHSLLYKIYLYKSFDEKKMIYKRQEKLFQKIYIIKNFPKQYSMGPDNI